MLQSARSEGLRETDALAAVTVRLSAARSLDEVMGLVTDAVRSHLQADGATFVLRDKDGCYYAEEDAISPLWKGRRFSMSSCISGWSMLHHEPVIVPDIYRDPRIPLDLYRPTFVRSLVMAPVGSDRAIAALGVYWSEVRQAGAEELALLQRLADAAGEAMSRLSDSPAGARRPSRFWAFGRPLQRFVAHLSDRGLRPDSIEAYAFAVLCVAVATLMRELFKLTNVSGLVIYSTYYPAAALAIVVGGRRAGVLALVLGGLAAYWFFMPPYYEFQPLTVSQTLNLTLYGGSCALIILIIERYRRAVTRLRQEDAKHLVLAREQAHRVQNAVTVVEAVVGQSLRQQPDQARLINRRLRAALADVDLDLAGHTQPRTIRALLNDELQGFDLSRFRLEGADDVPLPPDLCGLLALAAHELSTNAMKHGALSAPGGGVDVDWRIEDGRAIVCWREHGGPPVSAPSRRGYGSILLRRLVEAANGALAMNFETAGLAAEISLPLAPVDRG
jgi:two-component sensor histidine kinase